MNGSNGNRPCRGVTRRSFLTDTGMGLTGLVLGSMLFRDGIAQASAKAEGGRRRAEGPQVAPKAKHVIWIFMCGGVSHVDTFDVKPELTKYAGKSIEDTPYKDVLDPARVN